MGATSSSLALYIPIVVIVLFVVRFLQRKNRSPHRPTLTSFLDTACELFSCMKLGPWSQKPDIHTAMKKAMQSTKLSDWGANTDYSFVKRYELVRKVALKESGAKFSPVGQYYMMGALTKRMEVRLQLVDFLKRHPSIRQLPMKAPIFVVGFTRTGTTFLHEMLGLHEGVRMHYTWEQMDPVPGCGAAEDLATLEADRKRRHAKNKGFFDLMFKHIVSQHIQSIHRIGYDEPEECTTPCAVELPWALTELPFNAYAIDEISSFGAGEAFSYYRRFLQMMAWQSQERRDHDFTWMLKCPFHLPYLRELHKEFPDSTVVWTHRDPAQCIASALSLYETIMCMSMDENTVDRTKLGRAVMHYTRRSLDMAEEAIQELGDKFKILHVRYADTVKLPKQTCQRVYEKAGLPFSAEYEARVDAYLQRSNEQRRQLAERNKQRGKAAAVHAYSAEDYGLTTEMIRREFADYVEKYKL